MYAMINLQILIKNWNFIMSTESANWYKVILIEDKGL